MHPARIHMQDGQIENNVAIFFVHTLGVNQLQPVIYGVTSDQCHCSCSGGLKVRVVYSILIDRRTLAMFAMTFSWGTG